MADNPFKGLSKGQKVAVGVGGAVVVFMVYRSYSKAKAASASASTATDPNATDPNANIDPTTGYPYGSVQDTSALASGVGAGAGTGYDPNAGYYNPVPTGSSPASNAAWSQYVEQQLTSIGYDPQAVSAAIGRYLANLPLTPDQATIVQVALAEAGPPPQGSYSIITSGSSAPAGSGSGGGSGGTSVGSSAHAPAAPAWVREQWVNRTQTNVHWAPSPGASSYEVRVTYQSRAVQVHETAGQNYTITGLTPNHTYGVHVIAKNSAGQSGETSTTVKTPR
jgi:Fibronectin type III domain